MSKPPTPTAESNPIVLEESQKVDGSKSEKAAQTAPAQPVAAAPAPAKPVPAQPAAPAEPVRPTVAPARTRKRHWFLILSFLLFSVLPTVGAGIYFNRFAADQYASSVAFSVRSEESSSPIELLGGITDLSGSSSSDTDILYAYLNSQELVSKVDERVDLVEIWSKVSTQDDPIYAFDPSGTIEDLVSHWSRKITIIYDNSSKLIEIRVLAFEPADARRIAEAVLVESTEMINELSAIAREDAIRYARDDLDAALARLRTARTELTTFRNRTQIVDPSIDTQNQMGVLVTLQQQLADALIEYDLLLDNTNEDDPRISQALRRAEVIENRIDAERQKLGFGTGEEGGIVFANLVGEYEGLIVDREFAETAYTAALVTFDTASADSRRQSRYLAAHIRPTLAQKAEYPERLKLVLLVALFGFLAWSIICLVYYSLRDRR